MKLHLNLTLRRALMAAMAMVALHTADAGMAPTNGHMYVTGEVSPTTTEWTTAWGSTQGVLSVGTSAAAGTLTLTSGTYTTPNSIFLGGKGYESNGSTVSDGTLNIQKDATLTANGSTNVGNSQIGGTGTLTLNGGKLNAGNALYVGVNAGSGTVTAKDGATITVASGSTGAVFAMSHRGIGGLTDTATLTGSTITVGAKGGVTDYTSIGHSGGIATLNLEAGSTANFHDQLLVGEMGGSNGTINVTGGSTLNMGTTTVLGAAAGATGLICIEDGTAKGADTLVIGSKGTGTIEMLSDKAALAANSIELGDAAGSKGSIKAMGGSITTDLLTIGTSGTGSVVSAASIDATDIILGKNATGYGELTIKGKVTTDTLYAGEKGTGIVSVEGGTLEAGNAYIVGINSELATEAGKTTLTNATVLAGELSTAAGAETKVNGELFLDEAGKLVNSGITNIASATVAEGSITNDGTLTTGTIVNSGEITNSGIWNAKTSTTSTDGSIENSGTFNVSGDLTTDTVTGNGTTNVLKDGKWTITGQTDQKTIANANAITLQGAGRIDATTLSGTGTTTITIDGTTVATSDATSDDPAIIEVGTLDGQTIKVDIDTDNGASLVGKTFNFVEVNNSLIKLDQNNFYVDEGWTIDWAGNNISTSDTSTNGQQLSFTGGTDSMTFTKLAEKLADVTEEDTQKDVVYEDPTTGTEVSTTVTLEYEKQTLAATEKQLGGISDESKDLKAAIGTDTNQTLQTVVIESNQSNTTGGSGVENVVDMVIGSGLTTSSGLTVQTVVVNQITETGTTKEEKTAGTTGMVLILDGQNTIEGKENQKDNNHLGFSDAVNGQTLTTADQGEKKAQTIDLIQVNKGTSVTLSNLNMHSTHNLTVAAGATITFHGVDVKVGGSKDMDIKTETVLVEVKDANGNALTDSKGKIITKEVTVENKNAAHLDTGSVIGDTEKDPNKATETKVFITGGSVVEFETVRSADDKVELGTTTISGAKTEVVIDGATLGMNSVVKEKDNNGKEKEKHGQKIVFSNGSHLKGNGNLKNIHMSKDSVLTIGSSPGVFKASELTVEGMTRFYIIPNGNGWNYNGATTDATKDTGAISQLDVDKAVTLNGAQISFIYENLNPTGGVTELNGEELAAAKKDMGSEFTEGASIQFITGNLNQLTANGCTVNVDSLPTLDPESGLFWDVSEFFTKGIVTVMAEILEEPTRVANSMVSAGETVLNFGRLAQKQASLREAGTTRTWGSAIAMFDSIDSGSTTNGYDYSNWGAAVGIDHAFTKNTVVGVAFGCTWGENEAKEDNGYYSAGSIDQDAKMIGIYGVHKFQTKGLLNDVKLSAFAAYGMFENDSTRNGLKSGNTAKAEWDSDAWVLSASLSRDITTDSGVVFTPYVGVEYTTAGMDDFSEQGKSYTADYSADEDYSNLSVKVGVGVSKTYGSITPYANVAFISDIDRTAGEVTATGKRTITGKSALPGRNGFEIGVGATWQLTENLDVNAGYSAEIRDKASEHNARLGVGYTF